VKIIAINASPRNGWNTDILIREAARGAQSCGAQAEIIDLYKLGRPGEKEGTARNGFPG
jgi:multimeric flavodoxin WrbA